MAIGQRLSRNAPEIGGGITGVGGTVALREFADVQMGPLLGTAGTTLGRISTPSVAYGLGTGLLALGGWWTLGRGSSKDFLLAHGITALPSGAVSALLPKSGTTTTAAAAGRSRTRTRTRATRRATADGGQSGDLGGLGGLD